MKNKSNRRIGISLIILIITIIVVITLAAVVILTLSKNNPIESAKEARFKEDIRTFQDELAMYIAKDYTAKGGERDDKITATTLVDIQKYIPSFSKKYQGKFVIKNDGLVYKEDNLTKDEKDWIASIDVKGIVNLIPQEWRTYIADVTEDGVPIPKGFTYLEGSKDDGTVIEDENHNEFVWIPVDNISDYKKNTTYLEDLPSSITNENIDVEKYHGFYIGRYEATTHDGTSNTQVNSVEVPTCKKGKFVWTNISYTNSKNSAESMYTGEYSSVQSGLLTGTAWDTVCDWISDYKIVVDGVEKNISLSDTRNIRKSQ